MRLMQLLLEILATLERENNTKAEKGPTQVWSEMSRSAGVSQINHLVLEMVFISFSVYYFLYLPSLIAIV
jgi:hypothetical protein